MLYEVKLSVIFVVVQWFCVQCTVLVMCVREPMCVCMWSCMSVCGCVVCFLFSHYYFCTLMLMLYWCAVTTQIFHVFIGIKISWLDLTWSLSPHYQLLFLLPTPKKTLFQFGWKICNLSFKYIENYMCVLVYQLVFLIVGDGGGGRRACRELVEGGSGACVGCLWGCGGDVCKLLIIFIILPSLVV